MSPCSLLFCIDSNEMLIREQAPGQATPFSRSLTQLTSAKPCRALCQEGSGCSQKEGAELLPSTCSKLPPNLRGFLPWEVFLLQGFSPARFSFLQGFPPCKDFPTFEVFPSLRGFPPSSIFFLVRSPSLPKGFLVARFYSLARFSFFAIFFPTRSLFSM